MKSMQKKTFLCRSNEKKKEKSPEKQLPIFYSKEDILRQISKSPVTILVGETGSGKTTQLTQYLDEAGYTKAGVIACTQPRRVAAITVAKRVALEKKATLGKEVGYAVRFDNQYDKSTKIKYMTDGMLLREAMAGGKTTTLSGYSVIILDEAHERTIHTDVLFGVLKGVLTKRTDLKVVIMSATIESEKFSNYFHGAPVVYVSGRQFPVQIMYTAEPESDYLDACYITTLQIHETHPLGDILVFLSGQEEIEIMSSLLLEYQSKRASKPEVEPIESLRMLICPIFAALPSAEQMKAFEKAPEGYRKVILATNIAETSVTISGVRYVVDPGVAKVRGYNPKIGLETLTVQPISQAQARQRSGRAGREQSGICFRVYQEEEYLKLKKETIPEIKRCNMSSVVMQLKALNVQNIMEFDFLDRP
eukprot:Sdes_comp10372_c0_seq1m2027